MRIGCDIDGVLADFNTAFIDRVIAVTGRDLFPPRPFDITTWNYPQAYGYTADEVSAVWETINADRFFWRNLPRYESTFADLDYLAKQMLWFGSDVYFITARPGPTAKEQTEHWLRTHWPSLVVPSLTVLISSEKALCAVALNLDVYIDDRRENVQSVAVARGSKTRTFVMDRPWNRDPVLEHGYGIIRTSTVIDIAGHPLALSTPKAA